MEVNPTWHQRLKDEIRDSRLVLVGDAGQFDRYWPYDLILIDDGQCAEERSETIRLLDHVKDIPIVIHDYENLPYQRAAEAFEHVLVSTEQLPHTAVVWNGEFDPRPLLFTERMEELR